MIASKSQTLSAKESSKKSSLGSVSSRPSTAKINFDSKKTIKSRVSNITFKANLSHTEIDDLLYKAKEYYKKKDWTFNFAADIKKHNPFELFEASQILLIEVLIFHFCKKASIIKKIAAVNFPRLKTLSLDGNNIANWQILGQMDLENIQCITLRQNHCAVGKPLIKAKLPNLKIIDFPQIYQNGSQLIMRRADFIDSFSRLHINFESKSNIYPFILSLIFKEKNWDDDEFWITVNQCGIQANVLRKLKKILSRRSKLFMDTRWPLCISSPYYIQ